MHRLVVLLVVLSGCSDTSDPPVAEAPPEAAAWLPVMPPGATNLTTATTLTGTFELQDSRYLPVTPGRSQQLHDLAALVPQGALFTLVAEADAGTEGDIDLGVANGEGEGYEEVCDCPFGSYSKLSYTGVMGDRLDLIIQYDETGREASFDYTIDVTITGHGSALPAGAPMGIELATGDAVRFSGHVAVWDAADERVHDGSDMFTAVTPGEHVVMGLAPGEPFTIETNATEPGVRMLRTDPYGEEHAAEGGFTLNFTTPPMLISMEVCHIAEEFAEAPSLKVTGPAGVLFEESSGDIHADHGWYACYETETGDPSLWPGDYLIEADRERGVNGEVEYAYVVVGR